MPTALEAPPQLPRRLVATPSLVVVTALVLLLPLAALLGAFRGDRWVEVNSPALNAKVHSPTRAVFRDRVQLELVLTSDHGCSDTLAGFDPSWLSRFRRVNPAPDSDVLHIGPIAAGETRHVAVGLDPELVGFADGTVSISCGGQAPLVIPLSTFVFP
jgi:hypothetical protein